MPPAGAGPVTAALIAVGVAVILLGVLVAACLRHQAALARIVADLAAVARPGGVPVPPRRSLAGTPAVGIEGPDPTGEPDGRDWTGAGRTLVAFLTGGCTTCQPFWTAFADPATATEPGIAILVVTPSPTTESRRGIAARVGGSPAVIMSSAAWTSYGVRGAPWFVVIRDGIIESEGHAADWSELLSLVRR